MTLNSQGDTNLLGSQVKGNTVNANVSGYGNASKGTTHRKQVNEQAGIFAEEGGYHIDAQNVHLKGGAIASTNAQNSILQTNALTFEDIQNESSSKAASASISGSIKESKEKWMDNETGEKVKPHSPHSTFIPSQRSGGLSPGLPMLQQSSDSSTTKATLTEGTVILNKDTHPTQTTAKELGINTDLAQANNQVAQTKDVKAQIQEQQQIATAIGHVQKAVETYTANQQEAAEQEVRRLKSRLEKAEQQGNQEAVNQLKKDILQAKIQAENWGTGGSTKRAVDAITNAGLIALSGGSSQSIATAAASPYVNQLIKKATEDYPALNIPTHILWGAVEAELMGGKASTGAISTAAGELGAKYLTEHLYNKKAKDLTETERSQVKEMAKALAGVAGGLAAAGQGASAVKILSESSIGTTVANNAVEHNFLSKASRTRLNELIQKYKKNGKLSVKEQDEFLELTRVDHVSDALLIARLKNRKLMPLEQNYLDSLIERYISETATGRLNYGKRPQYIESMSRGRAEWLFSKNYAHGNYEKPYNFPYGAGNNVKNEAVKNLPENRKTWIGTRSTSDRSFEEGMYLKLELSQSQRAELPNSWTELISQVSEGLLLARAGKNVEPRVVKPKTNGLNVQSGLVHGNISKLSANNKLPVVGKTEGYENQLIKISNPHSPYLEIDKHGNEIYYRTLSKKDYEYLLNTGRIPATNETFISPLAAYSKQYEGILVRFHTKPGTSRSLQEIGVTGNSATKREVFPNMERAKKGWAENNQAQFKLEGSRKSPEINNGNGVVNTGLGKTEALNRFNNSIIKFEKIDK